jgi:hypothetical protein
MTWATTNPKSDPTQPEMTWNPKKIDNVRPKIRPDPNQIDTNSTSDSIIFLIKHTWSNSSEPEPDPPCPIATSILYSCECVDNYYKSVQFCPDIATMHHAFSIGDKTTASLSHAVIFLSTNQINDNSFPPMLFLRYSFPFWSSITTCSTTTPNNVVKI